MWYAITGGGGLAVGIALMIWALSERSRRHVAERAAAEAQQKEKEACALADAAHSATIALRNQIKRLQTQLNFAHARLVSARAIMRKFAPLSALKEFLDAEGKKDTA